MKPVYKVTVRVEVPVVFAADTFPEGTTHDVLRAAAAEAVEAALSKRIRDVADIAVLTGPGSGGSYPDGLETDGISAMGRRPVRGLTARLSTGGSR